jgi:hypothetical protein
MNASKLATSVPSNLSSVPDTAAQALHLDGETPGKAIQAADGIWIIATKHRPGFNRHMFEINNRTVVLRLRDQSLGRPVLLVANGSDPAQAVGEVRRIAVETGLPVKYVVSPGGGHHLTLDRWHEAFPEAHVLIPPTRIPRTENGRRLMQLPRVTVMDLNDPLPQFRGELEAVLFHGVVGGRDHKTPHEGGSHSFFGFIRGMMKVMKAVDPSDELWLFHRATGTVLAGENLAWMYPKADLARAPFMARQMLKPDRVWIWDMARKVADKQVVDSCWRRILAWPARTLMTYHDVPGHAFHGDGQAMLTEAVRASGQLL